jgi:hypothetical protein
VIVILPLDTIGRILTAIKGGSAKADGVLAGNIVDALNKAKKDKANIVGPLEPHYFNDLSAWCRSAGLTQEGETVEAAVRASG